MMDLRSETLTEQKMATLPEKGATRFRPYPEYRDSGVEWLGGIPVSWKVIKLKFATDLRNRKTDVSSVGLPYVGLENIESWSGNLVDGESKSYPSGIGGIFERRSREGPEPALFDRTFGWQRQELY